MFDEAATREHRVDRIAADDDAIGKTGPQCTPMRTCNWWSRARCVFSREIRFWNSISATIAASAAGNSEKRPVTRCIYDTTVLSWQALVQQIEVQLLELAPGGITEACEIRRRPDDVRKCERQRALEPACEFLLQQVLEPDDFRHAERAEVRHGGCTIPDGRSTYKPLHDRMPALRLSSRACAWQQLFQAACARCCLQTTPRDPRVSSDRLADR